MRLIYLLVRVYGLLLTLYPVAFRAEFEQEMRLTFSDHLIAAAKQGISSLIRVCVLEFGQLPIALLSQQCLRIGGKLQMYDHSFPQADVGVNRRSAGLAVAAFLIPILRWALVETPLAGALGQRPFATFDSSAGPACSSLC